MADVPLKTSVQGRSFSTSGPLKLIPKSKPSKVSSNPSGLLIVALVVAIFWIGFIAGWLARGA